MPLSATADSHGHKPQAQLRRNARPAPSTDLLLRSLHALRAGRLAMKNPAVFQSSPGSLFVCCPCPTLQGWTPPATWIWWEGRQLVVLCEDSSSSIFASAKQAFQGIAEVESAKVLQEEQPKWLQKQLVSRFPEPYYGGIYRFRGYEVVGVGVTVEHRLRAACVGLAVLMSSMPSCLPGRQLQLVWDEA